MRVLYLILSVSGWVWFVGLFGYLGWRQVRKEPRCIEVPKPEQQD